MKSQLGVLDHERAKRFLRGEGSLRGYERAMPLEMRVEPRHRLQRPLQSQRDPMGELLRKPLSLRGNERLLLLSYERHHVPIKGLRLCLRGAAVLGEAGPTVEQKDYVALQPHVLLLHLERVEEGELLLHQRVDSLCRQPQAVTAQGLYDVVLRPLLDCSPQHEVVEVVMELQNELRMVTSLWAINQNVQCVERVLMQEERNDRV